MFHPDYSLDLPTDGDLLAELGVDRHTVREIVEDERSIRCPERGAVYPAYGFASLTPEPASGLALHDAPPAEPYPATACRPAGQRWRRA